MRPTIRLGAVLYFGLSLCGLLGVPGPRYLWAQAPPPRTAPGQPPAPAFSPYLNLLRSGTSPAVNYYGIVRPELDIRNSVQQLQQRVSQNQERVTELGGSSTLPPTGHIVQFMNHRRYFMNQDTRAAQLRAPLPGIPAQSPATPPPARHQGTSGPH